MKFKYTGKRPAVFYRGITFPKGEGIEVGDDMALRLIDRSDFAEDKPKKKAAK